MGGRENVAHLLRRATFGPTADEVDAAERAGYAATVDQLISAEDEAVPPTLAGLAQDQQIQRLTEWWLDRMVATTAQYPEKLVFFWHGHWATSNDKVDSAPLMLMQQNVFRRLGQGDFAVFVKAMLRDAALVVWLDGQTNTRKAPNENLARELMELFTLGIGNYTEADIKAGARALTGWSVNRGTGQVRLDMGRFDSGDKTILGRTGKFGADDFADILMQQPANAKFLARRLWFRFATGSPIPADTEARLTAAYGSGRDLKALARALLTDANFPATRGQLVKQPTEWATGAMRQLGIRPSTWNDADRQTLTSGLDDMDQIVFMPPSVGGWPHGGAWLTTASVQVRLNLAELIAAKAPQSTVDKLAAAPEPGRIDALGRLLVIDTWTGRTRQALSGSVKDPRKLISMGLITPEYCVH